MSYLRLTSIAVLLTASCAASATCFAVTTDILDSTTVGTTDTTSDIYSSFGDDKIVLAARYDATSQGDIRGARLEAALQRMRQQAATTAGR